MTASAEESTENLAFMEGPPSPPDISPEILKGAKDHIFTKFFIVGIVDKSGSRNQRGVEGDPSELQTVVLEKFPPDQTDDALEKAVPAFCFPESDLLKAGETSMFVFVLTDSLGVKQYAFCKRREPKRGSRKLYSECLCILSHHQWFSTFAGMLEAIESRRAVSTTSVGPFLDAVVAHPFPGPGERFTIRVDTARNSEGLPVQYPLFRPDDSQACQHHIDYSDLFQIFDEAKIIKIFASLLFERRIMFVSSDLGRLSSVVHAAVSLLCPFYWQHVFIPILPNRLIDYVLAPMPFVIGIHKSLMDVISRLQNAMDEVIYVNLDDGSFTSPYKDYKLLPDPHMTRLRNNIKRFFPQKNEFALFSSLEEPGILNSPQTPTRSRISTRQLDQPANSEISESFLNFLSSIFEHYDAFFSPDHKFNLQEFRNSQPKNIQVFLDAFFGIQMYEQFIDERAKRRAQGLDIGFQVVVQNDSGFQRWVLSSKDVGKRVKSKAGKTLDSVLTSSKLITQKSLNMMKSGLEPAFKSETLKLFSPNKGDFLSKDGSSTPTRKEVSRSSSHTSFEGVVSSRSSSLKDFPLPDSEEVETVANVLEDMSIAREESFPKASSTLIDIAEEHSPETPSSAGDLGDIFTPSSENTGNRDTPGEILTFSPVPTLSFHSPAPPRRPSTVSPTSPNPSSTSPLPPLLPNPNEPLKQRPNSSFLSSKSFSVPNFNLNLNLSNRQLPTSGPSLPSFFSPTTAKAKSTTFTTSNFSSSSSSSSSSLSPSPVSSKAHLFYSPASSPATSSPPVVPPSPSSPSSSSSSSVPEKRHSSAPNYYVNTSSLMAGRPKPPEKDSVSSPSRASALFSDLVQLK